MQLFRAGQVVADPLREHFTPRYPLERTEIAPLRMIEKGPGHYFIDFGRDAFAALRLHYVGNASARVTVHMGEMLGPDNTVNRRPYNIFIRYHKAELDLKPGDRWYTPALREKDARRMPPEIGPVMPFRYCEIEGYPGKLAAEAIRQVAVHYLFDDKAARFTSSDATLNAVWELCKYSVKATSFCGVYVDGDRERLPYEADAYIGQLGHYCCDREFTLDRYSYEYLLTHPTWPTEYQNDLGASSLGRLHAHGRSNVASRELRGAQGENAHRPGARTAQLARCLPLPAAKSSSRFTAIGSAIWSTGPNTSATALSSGRSTRSSTPGIIAPWFR